MTPRELEWLKAVVRPTVTVIRRELLKSIRSEKSRHWKMRGTHSRGLYFERGFFRGLRHAELIVTQVLDAKRFSVKSRKKVHP